MREHARGGEAEDQRQHEREGGREQKPFPHELDRCERVRERRLEEDDGLVADRDGDVRIVTLGVRDPSPFDVPAHERGQGDRVSCNVSRATRARVGDDRERRLSSSTGRQKQ